MVKQFGDINNQQADGNTNARQPRNMSKSKSPP